MSIITEEQRPWVEAALRGEELEHRDNKQWGRISTIVMLLRAILLEHPIRIKPKTRELAGVTFPEPLRVAPEVGSFYWIADITNFPKPTRYEWTGCDVDKFWLTLQIIQATEEGARNQAKAMILSVGGRVE